MLPRGRREMGTWRLQPSPAGLVCGRPGGVSHGSSELSGTGPSCSQGGADVPVLLQTERG